MRLGAAPQDDTSASASPTLPVSSARASEIVCPLEIRDCIGTAAGERHDMIFPVTGAGTARPMDNAPDCSPNGNIS